MIPVRASMPGNWAVIVKLKGLLGIYTIITDWLLDKCIVRFIIAI